MVRQTLKALAMLTAGALVGYVFARGQIAEAVREPQARQPDEASAVGTLSPLASPAAALSGQDAQPLASPDPHDARFLILSPAGPVLVGLQVQVDGLPLEQVRAQVIDQLLADADTDRDGRATWEEATHNPQFAGGRFQSYAQRELQDRSCPAGPALAERRDTNRNGLLDRDEAATLAQIAWPRIQGDRNPRFHGERRDLFDTCDANHDGVLSQAEVTRSADAIQARDGNGDELIHPAECEPLPPPIDRQCDTSWPEAPTAHPWSTYPLWLRSARDDAILNLTFETRHRWGPAAARNRQLVGSGDARRLHEALGVPSPADLGQFLAGTCHLELEGQFANEANTFRLAVRRHIPELFRHLRQRSEGELEIALPGLTVVIDGSVPPTADWMAGRFRAFQDADRDQNGMVDAREFERVDGYVFAALDANADGQIALSEARAYLEARRDGARSCLTLAMSDASLPMFSWLDSNLDHVLGLREVLAAPVRLAALDVNRDGLIQREEIPPTAAITVRQGGLLPKPLPARQRALPSPSDDWFASMDRNGDGDISAREFLGTSDQFRAADRDGDGDGLLSREETRTQH